MLRVEENLRPTFFGLLHAENGLNDRSVSSGGRNGQGMVAQYTPERRRRLSFEENQFGTNPHRIIFDDPNLSFSDPNRNAQVHVEAVPSMDTITTLIESQESAQGMINMIGAVPSTNMMMGNFIQQMPILPHTRTIKSSFQFQRPTAVVKTYNSPEHPMQMSMVKQTEPARVYADQFYDSAVFILQPQVEPMLVQPTTVQTTMYSSPVINDLQLQNSLVQVVNTRGFNMGPDMTNSFAYNS